MNKLIPIFFLAVLFSITFISATDVEVEYYVRNGAVVNLTEKCFNNGTYCSSSAVCELSFNHTLASVI